MLTVVRNNENPGTISIPADELDKLGINDGDEVELARENDEIILRSTRQAERKRRFEQAKDRILDEWHDVFVELAKGADDNSKPPKPGGKFVLSKAEDHKYKFHLTAESGEIFFESTLFKSQKEANDAINSLKKLIDQANDKISDFPVEDKLEIV